MIAKDIDTGSELVLAAKLVGRPVLDVRQVGGGRNSRVYRVDTGEGLFALKQYPSLADDPRDRLTTEIRALQWMAGHGIDTVPRVVSIDRAMNCALLSWIEGVCVAEVSPYDVDQAVTFLGALQRLRRTFDFPSPQLGSEACLSGAEIEHQIRARVSQLETLTSEVTLQSFLSGEFCDLFEHFRAEARRKLSGASLSFDDNLNQEWQTLAPSDFGFHNSIRDQNGLLTFLDFEYFGWDDPVKLTSDTLFHPSTPRSESIRLRLQDALMRLYGDDPSFSKRLAVFFPLFGLRWVVILLNEFHANRWQRRVLAGEMDDWPHVKERQLHAARVMLSEISNLRGLE